jgi:hypothetical protein
MTIRFQLQTKVEFATANPILAAGELGIESDTGRSKLGTGTDAWNALNYNGEKPIPVAFSTAIPLDTPGVGKVMPTTPTPVVIAANTTFSLGPNPVQGGYCVVALQGDGTHTVTLPSTWIRKGTDTFSTTAGAVTALALEYNFSNVIYSWTPLSPGVVTASYVRFTVKENSNVTESGTGPYSYSTTFPAGACKMAGADHKFPAGQPSSLTMKCTAIGATGAFGTFCCFSTSQTGFTNQSASPLGIILQGDGSTTGQWYSAKNNAATIVNSGVFIILNGYTRLRRAQPGGIDTLYAEASPDNVTWTTIDSIAAAVGVDYWPKMELLQAAAGTFTMQAFSQTGMV